MAEFALATEQERLRDTQSAIGTPEMCQVRDPMLSSIGSLVFCMLCGYFAMCPREQRYGKRDGHQNPEIET